jgi:hypothetical protein
VEKVGMRNIRTKVRENDRCGELLVTFVYKRKHMKANLREERSVVYYSVKSNWKRENYVEVCTLEGGRKIV